MKHSRLAFAVVTLLLVMAAWSLAAGEITTPTDLDLEPAYSGTIADGDRLVITLGRDDFALLTLTPAVSGIYTFAAPNGETPAGGYVNITLYDAAGDKMLLYDSLSDALNENTLFAYESPNLYRLEPMVILRRNETIRIAVRINWSMTYNEPADGQDFTITLSCTPLEGGCGPNLDWSLDLASQTLTISGSGAMSDYSWGNAPWYPFKDQVVHVVIENGATSICSYAFAETSITDIQIPDSVTSIGASLFNMTGISDVTLRSHVTQVDANAFNGASSLTVRCEVGSAAQSVAQTNGIPYVYIPFTETLTLPADTVTIGGQAFANLGEHVNIEIPAETASIATDAFSGSTILLLVVPGSPAETWAETNNVPYLPIE